MPKEVAAAFDVFPEPVRERFLTIRSWIFDEAESEGIAKLEESLKWGEPSYGHRGGSPVRFGWKPDDPETCRLLFHCQSRLVPTFRELYGQGADALTFEGQRAIAFEHSSPPPEAVVRHCIVLAMRYHCVKNLPLLGATGPAAVASKSGVEQEQTGQGHQG